MIACLRSTRFMYPDRSASVFIDLRRLHNTAALNQRNAKSFVVSRRLSRPLDGLGTKMILNKWFNTLSEARSYWYEQAGILEDQGLTRLDFTISGFHEEG